MKRKIFFPTFATGSPSQGMSSHTPGRSSANFLSVAATFFASGFAAPSGLAPTWALTLRPSLMHGCSMKRYEERRDHDRAASHAARR